MTEKEMEYVSLSRDTTESDLKQRREITAGSAVHIDQVNHWDWDVSSYSFLFSYMCRSFSA